MSQRQNTKTQSAEGEQTQSRAGFLNLITFASGGVIAFLVGVPVLGALLAPAVQQSSNVWRTIGTLKDFPLGKTILVQFEHGDPQPWGGGANLTPAYVRRVNQTDFVGFSVNCQHLGCAVQWREAASLFMCPCHGGMYYADGSVAVGPPLTGLQRFHVRLNKNTVQIQTRPFAWPY